MLEAARCPNLVETLSSYWYVHRMEYYATVKKKEEGLYKVKWWPLGCTGKWQKQSVEEYLYEGREEGLNEGKCEGTFGVW